MTDTRPLHRHSNALIVIALLTILSCSAPAFGAFNAGTGFYITSDGYFLTCLGTVDGSTRVTLQGVNGGAVDAAVVKVDRANDLALLKANGKFSWLPLGSAAILGTGASILAVGFLDLDDERPQPEIVTGIVIDGSLAVTGHPAFQTTIAGKTGLCGAPVVTHGGDVAGVITVEADLGAGPGALPEQARENSFAVKASDATALVNLVSGVRHRAGKHTGKRPASISELASTAKHAIALVIVDTNRAMEKRRSEEREQLENIRREKRNEELRTEKSLFKLEAGQARQRQIANLQMLISNLDRDESSFHSQVSSAEQRLLYTTRDSKDLSAASARSELESRLGYLRSQLNQTSRSKEAAMQKLRELQFR